MKAIYQTAPERGGIEVRERDRPTPGPDEALVRVHSAGLCGSDAHAYKFDQGYEWIPIPRVMGHEYAGRVVEVGEHVSNVAVDDTVVERPIHECGHCFQCLNGQSNVCQNFEITGMHTDGAYTEYVTVDERYLVTIPEEVPLEHAAVTEPTSIAARAVLDQSVVQPGDRVLVEGPGPIGMLSAVIAHSLGANVVLSGLDRDADYRLPLGAELGLETVNAQRDDLDEVTDAFTDGVGFDVVFDTTGHHSGVEMAAEQIRRGGQIVVVGLPADDSELFMTPLVRGEVDLNTSYGSAHRNFRQALELMANDSIDPGVLIDTSFSVDDPTAAFEAFLAGETLKPVFGFWDP
ncbi:zinc-dependent alcohol dehydrogenase [Salinigranum salinum]|uniref:zinc-dependent alcohol dehydrogenase n=1 Tax=Salinigranum salinum TaxID=1364937 RepID=UPI00126062FA|nr:alcohol dehydrogenase catalytic domain-containing protein [Salinigranum salinum]